MLDRDRSSKSGRYYGRPLVVGLARLERISRGRDGERSAQGGGAVNAAAADKMIRFIDLCDTFHLPVVNFVDNPGFLIGSQAEREGTARIGRAGTDRGVSGESAMDLDSAAARVRRRRCGARQCARD